MEVRFTKLSDRHHALAVTRADGSTERIELDSRSFLRHDLAHFAVELELGLARGFWGLVAEGRSLQGEDLDSDDLSVAESLAGPMQTIMRTEATVAEISETLARIAPTLDEAELAPRLHERIRQLRGHWRATRYGSDLELTWPEPGPTGDPR